MKLLLTIPVLLLCGMIASMAGELPELFSREKFNSATLATAANYYIALGEERATKELKSLEVDTMKSPPQTGIQRNERIGWICRIIFEAKNNEPLRGPRYGALRLPFLSMPLERWPRYPVAESDGVFFVLSQGYVLAGLPEGASAYIDYCSSNGKFRKTPVKVPSRAEALSALESLKQSAAWKAIKWKDQGPGHKYTLNKDYVWRDIEPQASSIPMPMTEQ